MCRNKPWLILADRPELTCGNTSNIIFETLAACPHPNIQMFASNASQERHAAHLQSTNMKGACRAAKHAVAQP